MREQTLSLKVQAHDPISAEHLARTLHLRAASLEDDPTTTLFFGRVDTDGDERWYIGRRHVADDHGRPARHRLARADVDRVLPGVAGRADGCRAASPVRAGPRAGHGLRGRAPAGPQRARRPQPDPRRGDRATARRPDARHRRDHPARAGRDRAGRGRADHLRAGRAGHRQDGGGPAPSRVAALRLPRPAGPLGRPRHRAQPGLPRAHRRGAAGARRGRRGAHDDRGADGLGAGARGGPDRDRRPQGRRPARRGAAPGGVVGGAAGHRAARGAARRAQVARRGIRGAGDPRRAAARGVRYDAARQMLPQRLAHAVLLQMERCRRLPRRPGAGPGGTVAGRAPVCRGALAGARRQGRALRLAVRPGRAGPPRRATS